MRSASLILFLCVGVQQQSSDTQDGCGIVQTRFFATQRLQCRPHWHGGLDELLNIRAAKVQGLVGAEVSFEEFKVVSGVPAIAAAIAQLNTRLAARGARPQLRVMTHCS